MATEHRRFTKPTTQNRKQRDGTAIERAFDAERAVTVCRLASLPCAA